MWWLVLPLSSNLQIGEYIDFMKKIQIYYTTIPSLTLFLIWFLIHIMCAYGLAWV
jgi:hypothetical protein